MKDYSHVVENYNKIKAEVDDTCKKYGRNPESVRVLPVSKLHPYEAIKTAYLTGIIDFGENYVQELKNKFEQSQAEQHSNINWHLIGHLQTNKVKYIAPFVKMIHSVDSFKLANEINKHAEKSERVIDILLQVNTSGEESKSGCNVNEVFELFNSVNVLKNINILGLMTIAGLNEDLVQTKKEFILLRETLQNINKQFNLNLKELSMGMSGDFELAIAEGSTIIRIGTSIFGERNYESN